MAGYRSKTNADMRI